MGQQPKGVKTYSSGDKFLCRSCANGMVSRGVAEGQERIFCNWGGGDPVSIGFHVVECTAYTDRHTLSKWDMEKIAYVLVKDKKTGAMGFVSAKEYKKKNDDEDPLDIVLDK